LPNYTESNQPNNEDLFNSWLFLYFWESYASEYYTFYWALSLWKNEAEYQGTLITVYVREPESCNSGKNNCSKQPYYISQDFLKDANLPIKKMSKCTI
jgi:hypothetical protein